MLIPACLLALVMNSFWIVYEMKNAPMIEDEEAGVYEENQYVKSESDFN